MGFEAGTEEIAVRGRAAEDEGFEEGGEWKWEICVGHHL